MFNDAICAADVVVRLDVVKQAVVAVAPEVEALLGVADVEKGSLTGVVLHDLVDQVGHDFPLWAASILELIEQPVVKLTVEPEVHQLPRHRIDFAHRRSCGVGCEEVGEIGEGEASGAAHDTVVVVVIGL